MNSKLIAICVMLVGISAAHSQDKIYKCGGEYINNEKDAIARGCKPVTPKQLTESEKKDYAACRLDTAKAPTETGVRMGIEVCKEKFNAPK